MSSFFGFFAFGGLAADDDDAAAGEPRGAAGCTLWEEDFDDDEADAGAEAWGILLEELEARLVPQFEQNLHSKGMSFAHLWHLIVDGRGAGTILRASAAACSRATSFDFMTLTWVWKLGLTRTAACTFFSTRLQLSARVSEYVSMCV